VTKQFADPHLLEAWLAGRSLSRGLPAPVADSGGWRVDTGLPTETRRYLFASVTQGLYDLAASIIDPLVFLKLCAPAAAMRAIMPERWQVQETGYLMTVDHAPEQVRRLPAGFEMDISTTGPVTSVRIVTVDGTLAASGYAAESDRAFVYDRIRTEPPYRRLGLGLALMTALGRARRSPDAQQVLVATSDGRGLYSRLGWVVRSPYSTAVNP
jgi:GNAT superfamily N-acetyltransferase